MGGRYLTDLAEVCRGAGLVVVEVDGWPTRARGSGGYAGGKPDHVIVHHTASSASSDGWPDVNYCTFGDDDAPLCNLYLDRAGVVYVCAAGATNTNGKGDCAHLDPDTANSSAIGIEAGNDGVGEPWPTAQTSAYLVLVGALCAAYGIPVAHVHSHAEWAPDRKVDPYGPAPWGPATWDMHRFRADLDTGGGGRPPPANGDDDVEKICVRTVDGMPWVTDFASYATQVTEDQAARGRDKRGWSVAADGGPWPLDDLDSDLVYRLDR
jgi:hypothetical protein